MTDIYEIIEPNSVFKYKGKEYKVCDPQNSSKVAWFKSLDAWGKSDQTDVSLADKNAKQREFNETYVKLYLPEMTDEDFQAMGDMTLQSVVETINTLASEKFGAYVKKADEVKKP